MTRRLLLLSSSRDANGVYLLHSSTAIRSLLGESLHRVLFVPYAGVTIAHAEYAERAAVPFAKLGYEVHSIVDAPDPARAVREAEAIVIGGGNTFQLLASLYERELIEIIRERVHAGVPYIGWSAGAVITAPTMGTTNDMPIIEPPSLRASRRVLAPHHRRRDRAKRTRNRTRIFLRRATHGVLGRRRHLVSVAEMTGMVCDDCHGSSGLSMLYYR